MPPHPGFPRSGSRGLKMRSYDEYKLRVLEMSKRLSALGYFGSHSGSAGNVSTLIDPAGAGIIAITPTRLPYGAMTGDDICIVDFELHRIEGERKPSIEAPMHVAAYRTREDVEAVIHTHQSGASVCSIIDRAIPPLFDEVTLAIGRRVDLIPYALSGTAELHGNVARALANRCHCYIMQNHGALCVGPDLDKTFTFVELLEKTAAIYVEALATGQPITTLPDEIAAQLHAAMIARQDPEIARKRGNPR